MSLRQAMAGIADDRDTLTAAREVISYFDRHRDESVAVQVLERATGVPAWRLEPLLSAFSRALVLDCDGDPRRDGCRYHPDTVLELEVRRFLRAGISEDSALQRRVDRFRGRYGTGH